MSTSLVDDYATVATSMKKAESDKRAGILSDILKLAHSPDGSQEAALKLSDFMSNLSDDELTELTLQTNMAGPLAHLLSKFLDSKNKHVLLYTARTLKTMMKDDATREGLNKAGLSKSIAVALNYVLREAPSDPSAVSQAIDIKKEIFASIQSILFDSASAPEFASGGGVRAIGETLTQMFTKDDPERGFNQTMRKAGSDPELAVLVLASACNALSHCDTTLAAYIHEMRNWIAPICDALLRAGVPAQDVGVFFAACCLANATRDPGLTHALRAANGAEALDRCRHGNQKTADVCTVALNRLQISSGPKHDMEKVWRFRWGGGKGFGGVRTVEVFGLLAFLFGVTAFAGIIVLFLVHSFHF